MPGSFPLAATAMGVQSSADPVTQDAQAQTQAVQADAQSTDLQASRYAKAYALAAQAGDTDAMDELHQKALETYKAGTQRVIHADPANNNPGIGLDESLVRPALWAANKVGLESDDDLKQHDKDMAEAMSHGGTQLGNALGTMAVSLPVGGAGGLVAKGLGAATKGVPVLGGALARLAGRTALAGGENAAISDVEGGDPETAGEVGGALSLAGGAAGKLVKGVVDKSDTAKRLIAQAAAKGRDMFIPISQASDGLAGSLYRGMSLFPGVKAQLESQAKGAKNVFGDVAADTASPTGSVAGDTGQSKAMNLRTQQDAATQTANANFALNAPKDMEAEVMGRFNAHPTLSSLPKAQKQQIAASVGSVVDQYTDKGAISAASFPDLLKDVEAHVARTQASSGIALGGNTARQEAVNSVHDILDDNIGEHVNLSQDPTVSARTRASAAQTAQDMQQFKASLPNQANVEAIEKSASDPVTRGQLLPQAIAKNAPDASRLQVLGQDANEVLNKSASTHGGGHFSGPLALVYAAMHHPEIAASGTAIGNILATKGVQRTLTGDTATQQALARALRKVPISHAEGTALRQGVIDATGSN